MSGGGGSSSDSGGGNQQAAAKAAMTSNTAYSGSKSSSPMGPGSSNPKSSGQDNITRNTSVNLGLVNPGSSNPRSLHTNQTNINQSSNNISNDRLGRITSGQEPGYRADDSRPFGLSKEEAYRQGKITIDQRDAQPSITEQTERDITRDLTFSEQWNLAPDALKFSPALRFLYASGKNIGEWASKKGFELGGTGPNNFSTGGGDNERNIMNTLAPEAPYIVSGITPPSSSPAANWYSNLGTTSTNNSSNIGLQYANAKQAVAKTLSNKGALGMLAVNDSPYYDWLKTKSLDKGIL